MKKLIVIILAILILIALPISVSAEQRVILPPDNLSDGECDHSWVAYKTIPPTCTESGYTLYVCSKCENEKRDSEIVSLGHNYIIVPEVASTCTMKGHNEYQLCLRCGDSNYYEYNLSEHIPGEVVVDDIIYPTCTETGMHSEAMYCVNCGTELSFKTVEDMARGHNYALVETAESNCINRGYIKYTCVDCNDAYVEELDFAECKYENGFCIWCGSIDPEYESILDRFKDMPSKDSWAYDGLAYCILNGYIAGTSDATISPDMVMTRAMFVTILYRISGEAVSNIECPFTDLTANWYKDAAVWAYTKGITSGTSYTKFSPNMIITREQAATMLYNFNNTKEVRKTYLFPDSSDVSDWAKESMAWAIDAGIISGIDDGRNVLIKPQGELTRAQAATIIMKYTKLQ